MIHMNSVPLIVRLLFPLMLLVVGAGALRTSLLWQEEVQAAHQNKKDFAEDFIHLYGPRIAELLLAGEQDAVSTLLQREVDEYPLLSDLQLRHNDGQSIHVIKRVALPLQGPAWLSTMPGSLQTLHQTYPLQHRGSEAGQLVLGLSATPGLNRIWQSFSQQLWTIAGVLCGMGILIPLVLRSSLRGLKTLNKAAMQLARTPALRIRPDGAREIRQLATSFNDMAKALQEAREHAQGQLQQITWVASHDSLTGLPNRTLLADRLQQALHRSERHQELLALCFVDLDHFKPINDRHGHIVGDEVLVTAAQRMQAELRDTDTLARLGGDEFVLLFTSLQHPQEALAVVDRMLTSLRRTMSVQGLELQITASVGIALHGHKTHSNSDELPDADQLLRQADQAMYRAKEAGRDQRQVWETLGPMLRQSQRQWVDRMQQAIREGELRLHYQPKVNLRKGDVVGLEALVRWQHPERGLLGPAEFLPYVEHSNAIIDIGRWVMEEALSQIDRWQSGNLEWHVSINIAARQIVHADFIAELRAALARHPMVPPDALTLEILETSALDDMKQVRTTVEAAQALGVHCSLDDFGTGYSSLTYLKQLPVHELKIDQTFVRDMLDDPGDLALVEGIITLAEVFNRKLVAEGVETPEHCVLLLRLGCHVAQGWAIAKPMPADEVAPWAQQYQPDPLWALWAGTQWDLADFPLLMAQCDHLKWVKCVLATLDGEALGMSPEELRHHETCRFGHWYVNHGQKHYGNLEVFKAIEPVHKEVHRLGIEILRLQDTGDNILAKAAARQLLLCRDQILRDIEQLHRQVLLQSDEADSNHRNQAVIKPVSALALPHSGGQVSHHASVGLGNHPQALIGPGLGNTG